MIHSVTHWLVALVAGVFLLTAQAETRLQTGSVSYVELPREYRLNGVVEAIHQTTVSAQTSGQVEEILYDVDDYVEKGATLLRLKDREQRAQLTAAEASLNEAQANLKQASDEYQRINQIYAKELVSKSMMDKASADLKTAKARVQAARALLDQASEKMTYTQVLAPYSGIVTHRFVQLGEIAQPGQKLMSGISLDQLRVNVDVPQSLIPKIRQHNRARVEIPGNGWVPASKITVFPFADFGSNTFKVRLDLPEGTPDMFPGMFVKTAFQTGSGRVLTVPRQAVVHRSEVTAVYVVGASGEIGFRHIRLGHSAGENSVTVLSGLEAGKDD
jgi:RND family efflux transporter MFP subunit